MVLECRYDQKSVVLILGQLDMMVYLAKQRHAGFGMICDGTNVASNAQEQLHFATV